MANNRQNEVTKQLTIVATIFLPLVSSPDYFARILEFAVWGIGSEVAAGLALVAYFWYKRWF